MSWECAEAASALKQSVTPEAKVFSVTVSGNKRHHDKKSGILENKRKDLTPKIFITTYNLLLCTVDFWSLSIKLSHGETLGHVARQIPKEYLLLTDRDLLIGGGSCGRSLSTLACVTAEGGFNLRLCSVQKPAAVLQRVSLWESANGTRKQREQQNIREIWNRIEFKSHRWSRSPDELWLWDRSTTFGIRTLQFC